MQTFLVFFLGIFRSINMPKKKRFRLFFCYYTCAEKAVSSEKAYKMINTMLIRRGRRFWRTWQGRTASLRSCDRLSSPYQHTHWLLRPPRHPSSAALLSCCRRLCLPRHRRLCAVVGATQNTQVRKGERFGTQMVTGLRYRRLPTVNFQFPVCLKGSATGLRYRRLPKLISSFQFARGFRNPLGILERCGRCHRPQNFVPILSST